MVVWSLLSHDGKDEVVHAAMKKRERVQVPLEDLPSFIFALVVAV